MVTISSLDSLYCHSFFFLVKISSVDNNEFTIVRYAVYRFDALAYLIHLIKPIKLLEN